MTASKSAATTVEGVRNVRPTNAYSFSCVTVAYNPRSVFTRLNSEKLGGLTLIDPQHPENSVLHIVTSGDQEALNKFVEDMYEHENNREDDNTSLCALAESLVVKQIQPCAVRKVSSKNGVHNFGLIAGGRRVTARALIYAVSELMKMGQTKFPSGAKHLVEEIDALNVKPKPEFEANNISCSAVEAFDYAVRENKNRKDFNPIEDGRIYTEYLTMVNPENKNGKKFNLKSLASYLGEEYQHVRGRWILYNYYPEEMHQKVIDKRVNLTSAIQTAIEIKNKGKGDTSTDTKTRKRKNMLTRKQVEALFDENRGTESTEVILAKVMNLTHKQALKASDKRIREAEKAAAQAAKEEVTLDDAA